jgi:hypothetical protein
MKVKKIKRKSSYQIKIHQNRVNKYAQKKNKRLWYFTPTGWTMPYEVEDFISLRNKELKYLKNLLVEERYVELSGILLALCLKEKRYPDLFEMMLGILKKHKFLVNPFALEC